MWMKRLDESDDSFGEMFLAIFEGEPELIRFATVDIKSHILAQGNPEELEIPPKSRSGFILASCRRPLRTPFEPGNGH